MTDIYSTPQEAEDARAILRFFGDTWTDLARELDGTLCLVCANHPIPGWEEMTLETDNFPSIPPGSRVSLKTIAGADA